MITDGKPRHNRWWALAIGTGVALSPIHNQWLTNLTTNSRGEVMFFLPSFGYLLMIMGTGLFLVNNWQQIKQAGWGDRRVIGCLGFIVLAIALSGTSAIRLQDKFAPLLTGLCLFAMYLVGRVLGKELFKPLAIGAVIASLGVIAYSILCGVQRTGGFVFERNYDIFTGYAMLGTALFISSYQWTTAGLALAALFLSGSPEMLLPILVSGITAIARKDWSKKLGIILVPLVILVAVLFATGLGQQLFNHTMKIVRGEHTVEFTMDSGREVSESPITWRLDTIKRAMTNIKPLGEGYNLTGFTYDTVHNVPLILVQQMGYPGILAALAWLYISIYCLFKTKWKYAWLLILSLSVFDHFIWTQTAPVWWAVVGASTAGGIKSDLIFRRVK